MFLLPFRDTIRSNFIASTLLKKELWAKAGGFPDWRAAEDLIFMENVNKSGAVSTTAPDAMVLLAAKTRNYLDIPAV